MAAVNSVAAGTTRLPLAGFPAPRAAVLMCSAAMGAEGSVTLQLREAEGPADAAALGFGGVLARLQDDTDADLLADMLGTLHAAGVVDGTVEGGGTASFGILDAELRPEQELAILGSPAELEAACNTTEARATNTDATRIQAAKRPRPKAASPTRQGPQQCQMCSKVFGNASALAKHKLTHSDERKYVCTMCAKAFKRQDHLNGHMLTHRNKKPYECKAEGCGKSYCDARSLRRHRENHHGSSGDSGSGGSGGGSAGTNVETVQASSPSAASSLSPSTASGDASSPHGASCIQYAASPSPRPSAASRSQQVGRSGNSATAAGAGNEGLTRQQLELISQIMQQTKQQSHQQQTGNGNGQARSNKPPRTWNMQTQLQQSQKKSNTVGTGTAANNNGLSTSSGPTEAVKTVEQAESKPVECNLCHRKFKNIPALNGHMRLHGGYFKKDSDNKKLDKKESALPPLQTASQSVRALIEEKIISRQQRGTVTTTPSNAAGASVPAASAAQQLIGRGVTTTTASDFAVPAAPPRRSSEGEAPYAEGGAVGSGKDATLIELLKRGTKLQVKRSLSDSGATGQVQLSLQQATDAAGNVTAGGEVFTLAYQNHGPGAANTFYTTGDEVYVQDTAMLLQAVNSIQLLQQEADAEEQETLQDIASLEDYAAVSADLDVQSPEGYSQTTPCQTASSLFAPVTRELRAVLDSPLPEGLAELGAYQDPPHSPKDLAAYQKEYLMYTGSPPSPLRYPCDSPGLGYPTPPASHETQVSQHSLEQAQQQHSLDQQQQQQQQQQQCFSLEEARQTSSPLSAAFFTATMSSAEEVEEALETVLPGEMDVYDPQSPLQMSYLQTAQQMMMPNSDDPLLSSSPKDFAGRKKFEFGAGGARTQRRGYNYVEADTKQEESTAYICESVPRSRKRLRSVDMWPNDAGSTSPCSSRRAYSSRLKAGLNNPLQFTPTPMLDPDRQGPGLFKQVGPGQQQVGAGAATAGGDGAGEGAEPRVNIGTAYQVALPECSALREMDDPVREHLLWDPGIVNCTEQEVERYLHFCSSGTSPWSPLGEEAALRELMRCRGDCSTARGRVLRGGCGTAAGGRVADCWSREEVEAFQAAVMRWRKDFGAISREVGTKTTGQCVAFYYIWKKVFGDYKSCYPSGQQRRPQQHQPQQQETHQEPVGTAGTVLVDSRPHHCEMPDCSASFSSRAALHGHTRIHSSGAGGALPSTAPSPSSATQTGLACSTPVPATSLLQQQLTADQTADEYPCRICGKVFIKVKSRSAHMKSHRPVESSDTARGANKNAPLVPRSPIQSAGATALT